MILYVNGDSHSAAAEAVNNHCFANDDAKFWRPENHLKPHPDNLAVSYGKKLADAIGAELYCDALSAASNYRIIRTTKKYLETNKPDIIVIGWSTWEREEWYDEDDGFYYQVNASGADQVPEKWQERYKNFIVNVDFYDKTIFWHKEIWLFHNFLNMLNIPHLFFNCHNTFLYIDYNPLAINQIQIERYDWGLNYICPYDQLSYYDYLSSLGYTQTKWGHFGPDGHAKWAEFLLPHLTKLL